MLHLIALNLFYGTIIGPQQLKERCKVCKQVHTEQQWLWKTHYSICVVCDGGLCTAIIIISHAMAIIEC